MTALRVTPISTAIWLHEYPALMQALSCSTRVEVQVFELPVAEVSVLEVPIAELAVARCAILVLPFGWIGWPSCEFLSRRSASCSRPGRSNGFAALIRAQLLD